MTTIKGGTQIMRAVLPLAAAAIAVLGAGAAAAQSPQSVTVEGTAERSCTLPDSWTVTNLAGGAAAGQFSGTTWTIPEALFVNASSQSAAGADVGLRIRGAGFCNASHTLRMQSARGGLVAGDPGDPAPAGFSRRRPVRYDAFWSNGSGGAFGPAAIFTPASPGAQSNAASFAVSNALAPPGNRGFDVRFILDRTSPGATMVAGAYSDTVTITLALNP